MAYLYAPLQEARCFVTIEEGADLRIRLWRGSSMKSIKRAVRDTYPEARLTYGRCFYRTL